MQVKKKYLTLHSRLRKTPNTATPGAVVQLVRIRACHARGRGFEPHPHRKNASHICEGRFSYGNPYRLVRTKTFSAHDEPKICHVVRKSGVFTHGKNSHDGVGCIKTSLCLLTSPAGWSLWRFASLIPSGCRLTPIHKVMGDHASRGSTPAGLFLPRGLFSVILLRCPFGTE